MKILLDLQGAQTESRFRGIGRQTVAFARALIASGGSHDIHVLLNRRLDEGMNRIIRDFGPLLPQSNIHVFGVPGATAERESDNLWRTKAAEHVREAAIARVAPDILHVASLFEGYVDDAVVSIGRFDAPWLTAVTLHDLIPLADPDRYLGDAGVRRHWLRKAQFLKRADLLLSVSQYSADEAEERLSIERARLVIMGNGVDPKFSVGAPGYEDAALRSRYDLRGPFLLHVGAVDPRKNVELIFAAFALLPEPLRENRLIVFAGRLFEEEIGQLRIAAARNGVPVSQLRFCQHVSEDNLVALYRAAEVFLFPSRHEGFGLPALEAMACGAPTLAADATALREIVTDPASRFDPVDPASLATKLEALMTDPGRRQAMRTRGIERAAEFTWERTARTALDAFEGFRDRCPPASPIFVRKPLLAFFSPLPGDKSGVADYSAELLPELARFYEIECIISPDTQLTDDWIITNFVTRDYEFFRKNAAQYNRIIYSIGNSHFHGEMIELLARYPGVVILHDFFLSDLIDWMSSDGIRPYEDFFRELYRSHGLAGLAFERKQGRRAAVAKYPCSLSVFQGACGIIVHSRYSVGQARTFYGESAASLMAVIPHLRAVHGDLDRNAARARLGIGPDEIVIASFGILTERKRSVDLLEAWRGARTSKRPHARLVFVGAPGGGAYGEALGREIAAEPNISVTGHASQQEYRDYLAAADVAVQLRRESRGETSGTILDCLAAGVPLIVNSHAAAAELPNDIVTKLDDDFSAGSLSDAIDRLVEDRTSAAVRGERGRGLLKRDHNPGTIGSAFHDTIEAFEKARPRQVSRALYSALGDFVSPVYPERDDLRRLSVVLGEAAPRLGQCQILYDVTVLAESDAKTGIQRVVRSILASLIENPPSGFRIEPVRMAGHELRYARRWVADTFDLPSWVYPDDPVDGVAGDIYLSIDWVPDRLPLIETWLHDFRRTGGRVVIGVHDLLPFQLPQFFPDFMPMVGQRWFEAVLRVADQLVCVSRSVAEDVVKFGRAMRAPDETRSIAVDYFHNAADIDASLPTSGMPADSTAVLSALAVRPTFLMVGTIEPRKGHGQVLAGFEKLWRQHHDVNLVVVGKAGWMMTGLIEQFASHPEFGQRLFWLDGISDEYLNAVYAASTALIAASFGEGFGLPLIEAALHGTAIIARDIPVFREVAGDHAFYFNGLEPNDVAGAIVNWLRLDAEKKAPTSVGMPCQSWRESTDQLVKRLFAADHYAVLAPPSEGKSDKAI